MATKKKRPSSHECDRIVLVEAVVRQRAHAWCKHSFGGSWANTSEADLILKPIVGGLSNYLFLCSLPESVLTAEKEPRTVLVRFFGHIRKSSQEFVVQNSVVLDLLSEREISPKVYGNHEEGRIEEYIPTRCLLREEIRRGDVSQLIAQKLALSHLLDMPLPREPRWLPQIIGKWLDEMQDNILNENVQNNEYKRKLHGFNLGKEFKNILQMLESTSSPVVFCHNDLQEGNILYRENCEDKSKQLILIDWEYCSYNYSWYDSANHFCEWALDYTDKNPPYFSHHPDDFPKKEQQLKFLRDYLEVLNPRTQMSDEELEAMAVEVNSFVPVSHFLWGMWAIIEAQASCIQFGYSEYAICRLELYFSTKGKMGAVMGSRMD